MKPLTIGLIIALLIIPIATASSIFDVLLSTEKNPNNGICENGEWVWEKDCAVTADNIDDIITTGWFFKILMIVIAVLIYKNRKRIDFKDIIFIGLLLFILFNFNFSEFGWEEKTPQDINKTKLNISHLKGETIKVANMLNVTAMGDGFLPRHPNLSWLVFFIVAFLIFSILMGLHLRIVGWIGGRK